MPATLIQHLNHSAESFPNNCAFRFQEEEISYRELAQRSAALGGYLRDSGVSSGDRIGILLNRSIDMVIAVYGVLYAGAAYVPIDNTAPSKRIVAIINQCAIGLVISNARLSDRLEKADVSTVITDRGCEWLDIFQRLSTQSVKIRESDIAYIMFTSGSTNEPKGIVHSHGSAAAFVTMMAERYGLQSSDRVMGVSPLHFDMSTFDIFAANYVSACTILSSEAHQKIPTSLTQLAEHESVTVWYSTPFALIQCLEYGVLEQRSLNKLRWIIYAGEAFPVDQLNRLMNLFSETRFSNAYGPAETNVCHTFDIPPDGWQGSNIPIGIACQGVSTKVIDENGNISKTGELWVSCPTMMNAYWDAPELTRETLVANKQGQLYYKTGDIVEVTDDGLFYFLGRKDRQVKLRGFRVELEEIETALTSSTIVKLASAAVIGNEHNIPIICADVLLEAGTNITEQELLLLLAEKLPSYAMPQRIRFKSEFPMSSSGKIDRRKLTWQWQHPEKENIWY